MFVPELELYAIILWFHPKTQVLTNCHQKNICQLHVPFLCTTVTETKLRIFQFKFLHRRIATNDLLLKIGKKETHPCSFCADSPETLTHLFWDCRLTQTFWNVSQWISESLDPTNITPFSPALFLGLTDKFDNPVYSYTNFSLSLLNSSIGKYCWRGFVWRITQQDFIREFRVKSIHQ